MSKNRNLLFLALSTSFILTPKISEASDLELDKLIDESNVVINELNRNSEDLDSLSYYKSDPNDTYESDSRKTGSFKESSLGPENTNISKGYEIINSNKYEEGIKIDNKNPSSKKKDYSLNINIDKRAGERTYNRIEIIDKQKDKGNIKTSSKNLLSDKDLDGDKSDILDDSQIKMEKTISKGNVNFKMTLTKKGLKYINNREVTNLNYKDSYLKTISDPRDLLFNNKNFKLTADVNPYPNENRNFERIYLEGFNNLSKVPVKGQYIQTGYNVKNLNYEDYTRVCGEIYYPDGSRLSGGKVIVISPDNIDQFRFSYENIKYGDVLIKLPKGALEDPNSIFNQNPMKNALNLRSKLFIRPRTHVEFSDIAYIKNFDNWDKMSDDEVKNLIDNYNKVNWKRTYFTGGSKETIKHNGEDVVISKQGINRYDHYNLLGEINIGLDDKRYHLLDFERHNNGSNVSNVRPGVKMSFRLKDSYDKMYNNYVDKNVDIDWNLEEIEKYRSLGWEIDFDNVGELTVKAPYDAKDNDMIALSLKYRYTNGSIDEAFFTLNVKKDNIVNYKDYSFHKEDSINIDKPLVSDKTILSYEIVESEIDGLSINSSTGEITGNISDHTPLGKSFKVVVKALLDDGSFTYTSFNITTLKNGDSSGNIKDDVESESVTEVEVEVPFKTRILYDENFPIGYEEVVSDGENGIKKYIYTQKFLNGFKNGPVKKDEKNIKDPVDRVIRIGSKEIYEDVEVGFKTNVSFDPDLPLGKKIVKSDGINGLTRIYTRRDPITHKIYTEKEIINESVDSDIKYGTKTDTSSESTQNTIVHKEEIPFKYDIIYDDSLDKGEVEIVNKGSEGSIITTYHLKNSEVIDKEEKRVEAINALIKVGSKSFDGLIEINDRKILKKDTEIVYNNKLKKGEVNVLNEGSDGYVDLSYMQNVRDSKTLGKSFIRENSKVDPVNKVIEIGTMDDVKPDIPVEVEFIYDNTLDKGVVSKDKFIKGSIETKTIYEYVDGQFIEKSVDQVKPSIQKIRVGSRDYSGEFSYVERKVIPYETEVKVDPTLKVGEVLVYRDGSFGESETLVTQSFINGKKGEIRKGDEKITKKPINKIVRVGAKSDGVYTYTKEIGYDTKIEYDPSLDKGEVKIVDGKLGSETIKLTIKNSKVISSEPINKTDKVDKIIKIGSRDFTGNFSKEVKEIIPFKVQIIEDESLSDGSMIVDQKGEAGFVLNNITYNLKNGSLLSEDKKEISRVEAKDHIIRVGKRKLSNKASVKTKNDIGFDVEIVYDNTKPLGYVKEVDGTGMKGLSETETLVGLDGKNIVVGDSKTDIIKNPINKKIIIGTKDFTGEFSHVYKEIIPYKTKVIFDEDMKVGEMKVFKEGAFGSVEKIVKQKYTNGNLSEKIVSDGKKVDPVDKIIKVGKLSEGSYVYKDVIKKSFKLVYDETLNKGEKKIIEGKDGSLETTFTIKNSEVVDTKTKRVDPIDTIIKVGSRDFTGKVNHTEHFIENYNTLIKYNDKLESGKINTLSEGHNGSYDIEYTQNIKNGEISGDLIKNKKNYKKSVDRIIEIGTKNKEIIGENSEKIEKVPVEIEYKYDNTLDKGVVKNGEFTLGKVYIKTVNKVVNGKIQTIYENKVAPSKQVIIVGSRNFTGKNSYKTKEFINYNVKIVYDKDLEMGQRKVIKEGSFGEISKVYESNIKNGKVLSTKLISEKKIKDAEDKIIHIGIKGMNLKGEKVEEIKIPFNRKYIYDDNLEVGKKIIDKKGSDGLERVRFFIEGDSIKKEIVSVKGASDEVIRIGRKPIVKEIETSFYTEYKLNPDLKYNEIKVIKEGVPGKIIVKTILENDEIKNIYEKIEGSKKIVEIGSLREGKFSYKADIAYETIIKYDALKSKTYSEVVSEGSLGVKEVVLNIKNSKVIDSEEKVIKKPVNKVIVIGKGKVHEDPIEDDSKDDDKKAIPWTKIEDIAKPIEDNNKENPKEDSKDNDKNPIEDDKKSSDEGNKEDSSSKDIEDGKSIPWTKTQDNAEIIEDKKPDSLSKDKEVDKGFDEISSDDKENNNKNSKDNLDKDTSKEDNKKPVENDKKDDFKENDKKPIEDDEKSFDEDNKENPSSKDKNDEKDSKVNDEKSVKNKKESSKIDGEKLSDENNNIFIKENVQTGVESTKILVGLITSSGMYISLRKKKKFD